MSTKSTEVAWSIGLIENETALQMCWFIALRSPDRGIRGIRGIQANRWRWIQNTRKSWLSVSTLSNFFKDVNNLSLLLFFNDVGNSFFVNDDSNDLLDLETKVVLPNNSKSNLLELETVGTKQIADFMKNKKLKRLS